MTREEKIKLAIDKGFTYDEDTGKIFGIKGSEVTSKIKEYIRINFYYNKKIYCVMGHQFAFYKKYGKVVDCIDHINGIKDDNRIDNLRSVTQQQNTFNKTKIKGYCFCKKSNKYRTTIKLNYKTIHIGLFHTEQEARQAYLDAKQKYHLI